MNRVTAKEVNKIFKATNKLSYKVFFFTIYSLGLRLEEGIRLKVGDIDSSRMRVHIRYAKGNKDRLVPLPEKTLQLLRKFWLVFRPKNSDHNIGNINYSQITCIKPVIFV